MAQRIIVYELRFLDPGVEACIRNCRERPWEPHEYADPEEQQRRLAFLLEWVAAYDERDDELSGPRHRDVRGLPGQQAPLRRRGRVVTPIAARRSAHRGLASASSTSPAPLQSLSPAW